MGKKKVEFASSLTATDNKGFKKLSKVLAYLLIFKSETFQIWQWSECLFEEHTSNKNILYLQVEDISTQMEALKWNIWLVCGEPILLCCLFDEYWNHRVPSLDVWQDVNFNEVSQVSSKNHVWF